MSVVVVEIGVGNKLVKVLDGGVYYFWRNGTSIKVDTVDTRLVQLNVLGQEILTQDKVSLRINFVCNYKLTDIVKSVTEIDDYEEQIRLTCQMSLRDYVGKHKLDEILDNKEEISEFVFSKIKEKEKELYISVSNAGVKDIILPGEIRNIMNTVLVAEKQAQANVITRREEVASTRSLLNTAKLMDENQTLYKLKELEYIERICENVGNISLNGGDGIIAQLSTILKGK
jgi:regulator of protease activity HflC (stomatin/prohibitin superfamily)